MDRARASAHDRFQSVNLMPDAAIACGAPLGRTPVAEQARRHAAKRLPQGRHHGAPGAPVLHDPGTNTSVGPVPRSS